MYMRVLGHVHVCLCVGHISIHVCGGHVHVCVSALIAQSSYIVLIILFVFITNL